MKKLYTLLILFSALQLAAQEKREMERGVKQKEVPKPAVSWMRDSYEGARKIQWFFQQDGQEQGYEAKLKWQGKWHSVEFDTTGGVRNVEVTVSWDMLSDTLRASLTDFFDQTYRKWSIEKVQMQWLGQSEDLEDWIDELEMEGLTLNLEVEYRGLSDEGDALWEGLFDAQGGLIYKRKIILGNLNNLTY